jgi:lipopolysaccharide heptosyltransferase II
VAVPERILIIRNQGIGDLILITPAIRALRQLHPQAHLAIAVGQWSSVALEGNPHLDEIIAYPDPWVQNKQPLGFTRLVARLRMKRFDAAYIFHSHTMIHLMAMLAGIPRRFGFYDLELNKKGSWLQAKALWQPNTDRYIADNYLDIPRLAGFQGNDLSLDFFLSDQQQAKADQILTDHGLEAGGYFVVAPGGGINPRQNVLEKRWPANRYAELCNLLFRSFKLPIILVGSGAEADLGRAIAETSPEGVIDLIGKAPFDVTAGLIRKSRMLVSNDSSVMHVAVAYKVSSLAIFGPSNPRSLLPVSQVNQWIGSGLDCRPCYCNSIFQGCQRDLQCMTDLAPDQVFAKIEQMLGNNRR